MTDKQLDYFELQKYAATDHQKRVMEMMGSGMSKTAVAKDLDISRQRIQEIIKVVVKQAERRLYAPEHGLTLGTPPGFTGDYTAHDVIKTEEGVRQVWYKGKAEKGAQDQLLKAMLEGLTADIKPSKLIKKPKGHHSKDLASCIVMGDAHLGMAADGAETLYEDFDLSIACRDLIAAVDYLVASAPKAHEGLLINVGDFLHIDDFSNATPENRNPLDVSGRWSNLIRVAGAVMRHCIDRMAETFPQVRVVNAKGNHDPTSAVALSMYLEGIYEKNPRVIIEPTHAKFYFYEFGNNLIGVNHGDKINANRLAGVMTTVAHEAWGRTKFRRWWVGHIHHKRYLELDAGCSIESFNTLAPPDAWHSESGYGAERGMEMITLHKEYGQVGRHNAGLDMVRAWAAK